MGVRAGVFVCVTSFLLGALFTHWIADSLTLWKSPVTDEHLWTAASYYSILAKVPTAWLHFLRSLVLLGAVTILWSLNDLGAGNIMFDGGSIFLFGTTIVVYLNSVMPTFAQFGALPPHLATDIFPKVLRTTVLDLASNHLICSVALTGVLALQAGRYFAEKADEEDEDDYVLVDSEFESSSTKPTPSRAKTPEKELPVKPLRLDTTN
ncbi:hypothetical protein EST38_g1737 [Candolleomyces aberdarensis]|uniref:Shr3 amino acid permease chaperone n=1 Tax=Candolleomyces aberdarensis TaxID=2316362 RepID=A0A4Q2DXE6_9AGAR|nr:hypothetical protein EST38_g1737 [Candolleomyces aberdarensis]